MDRYGKAEEPDRQRLRLRSKMARIQRWSGSEDVELSRDGTASTPPATKSMSNTDNTGTTTNPASDSSSDLTGGVYEYEKQDSEARRKQVATNRALWESTLPKATEHLPGEMDPEYTYINYEDTPKREFRTKRTKSDLFEFPKIPFRR